MYMNRGDKDYTKLSIAREKIRIHEKNKTGKDILVCSDEALDNLYKEYEVCGDCGEMRKTSEFYQYSHQVLTLLDNDIAYNDDNDQIELSFNKNYNDTTQTIIVSK